MEEIKITKDHYVSAINHHTSEDNPTEYPNESSKRKDQDLEPQTYQFLAFQALHNEREETKKKLQESALETLKWKAEHERQKLQKDKAERKIESLENEKEDIQMKMERTIQSLDQQISKITLRNQ